MSKREGWSFDPQNLHKCLDGYSSSPVILAYKGQGSILRVSGWAWPDILMSSGFIWESLPHWIPWKRDPGRFQTWPWCLHRHTQAYTYGSHIHINMHIHVTIHKCEKIWKLVWTLGRCSHLGSVSGKAHGGMIWKIRGGSLIRVLKDEKESSPSR